MSEEYKYKVCFPHPAGGTLNMPTSKEAWELCQIIVGASSKQLTAIKTMLLGEHSIKSELIATHICSPLYEALHGENIPVGEWEHTISWVEVKARTK